VALPLIALLFAGLFFSYSQSSFAALFVVVAVVAALAGDRRMRITLVAAGSLAAVLSAAVVVAAAHDKSPRKVTSDRSRRIELTLHVFADHPAAGVGIGAQPLASQKRSARYGPTENFVSHTTPLTIAAELGVVGVALYGVLLFAAVTVLEAVRRRAPPLGLALEAVFLALFVHALAYSGFLEDPITWLVLAIAACFLAYAAPAPPRPAPPVSEPRREPVGAR
jgi:hypothetical protein